ncbi:MAG: hypothetical protein QG656_1936 [Candidatus Hydrogenedentes bacterium]|nr:hypothetical protein [Candidatus Hydrogenedentota bacterium]
MREYTVVALVRPREVAWGDTEAVDSAARVDWVDAESADAARYAFIRACSKRSGRAPEDVTVVAVFAGRLTEGEPQPRYAAKQSAAARDPKAAKGDANASAQAKSGPALVTTKQFLEKHPCFTSAWLRAALFRRETNGLNAAIVQCGTKILIDEARFFEWLGAQRGGGST